MELIWSASSAQRQTSTPVSNTTPKDAWFVHHSHTSCMKPALLIIRASVWEKLPLVTPTTLQDVTNARLDTFFKVVFVIKFTGTIFKLKVDSLLDLYHLKFILYILLLSSLLFFTLNFLLFLKLLVSRKIDFWMILFHFSLINILC